MSPMACLANLPALGLEDNSQDTLTDGLNTSKIHLAPNGVPPFTCMTRSIELPRLPQDQQKNAGRSDRSTQEGRESTLSS